LPIRLKDEIYDAVLELYLQGYRTAALVIGLYYLLLIPIHFVAQAPGVGPWMILANLPTAGVFLVSHLGIRQGRILARQWPLVAVTCLLTPTANHLMLVGLTGRMELTSDLLLIIVAASVVSPDVRWHLAILGSCILSWVAAIFFLKPHGDLIHWSVAMLSATMVSFALHAIVRRLSWKQAVLRMRDAHLVARQRRVSRALQEALDNLRVLRGLIPICGHCKKIRDDGGYWMQVESYIEERSEAEFTHGLCPQCETHLKHEFEDLMPSQPKRPLS
jgi:hypothetical protein